MNEMGYTAMALGNHEFDYGVERLKELSDAADFPMLSLNFVDSEGKPVFKSYVIKELGNRKIAFIGISTPKTLTSSTPTYFMDDNGNYIYSFLQDETGNKLWDAVQNTVDEAKADGADMVIALTHLGIESSYAPYDASELIANTVGIDAVLDGHAHIETQMEEIKNKNGEDVLFSSAGYKNEKIGVLTISPEGELSAELKEVTDKDTDFEEYLKKIEADYTDRLNEKVAENDFNLIMNDPVTGVRLIRNQETNLGDFCADAYLYAAKKAGIDADIALVNGGGIRAELLSGSITYGDILSVFPYGNVLSVIKATGTQIRDALEISAAYAPEESGGFEQVAGISYTIDETMPSCVKFDSDGAFCGVDGEYRVSDIKVNGQDLDLNREYTVVSHDYLIKSGGDGINVFMNDEFILEDFTDDYEVLTDYINYVNNSEDTDYSNEEGMGRITIKSE
jgi:2',3'-cyclic-nucleotide 2'-phosphodiesterase (5'-nucleotidase family)